MTTPTITIRNFNTDTPRRGEVAFNVSRISKKGLPKTSLENPFRINKNRTREEAIKEYRHNLWRRFTSGDTALHKDLALICYQLEIGRPVALWCYCTPKECHAEQIKRLIEFMLANSKKTPKLP